MGIPHLQNMEEPGMGNCKRNFFQMVFLHGPGQKILDWRELTTVDDSQIPLRGSAVSFAFEIEL
jgi:hypothetical protein